MADYWRVIDNTYRIEVRTKTLKEIKDVEKILDGWKIVCEGRNDSENIFLTTFEGETDDKSELKTLALEVKKYADRKDKERDKDKCAKAERDEILAVLKKDSGTPRKSRARNAKSTRKTRSK